MKTPRLTDFDPDAKLPTLKSSLDGMPSIEKPQPVVPPPPAEKQAPAAQKPPAPLPQSSKTTNAELPKSEKFDKYSTYLRPGYKKELKIIALERDCKDYEVLDEAITLYLKSLRKQ